MLVGSEGWAVCCCVDGCCDDLFSRENAMILIQNAFHIEAARTSPKSTLQASNVKLRTRTR